MRITTFGGEAPKLKPHELPVGMAVFAEDVDLYAGRLKPLKAPQYRTALVDEYGATISDAACFVLVGAYYVGFPEDTHWVYDPRESAGGDTILFVRGGEVFRLSSRMIRDGVGAIALGIDPPEEAPVVDVSEGGGCLHEWDMRCGTVSHTCDPDADAPEVRAYRITYLNACGEESAPSPVSNLVDIKNGDGAIVADLNTPPSNATRRRIYRSGVTTSGETVWLFVAENNISETAFIDDVCVGDLGEALSTDEHYPPIDCVEGIALSRNLSTIVWAGNNFWVSEPRLPHAYRPATRVVLPYDIQAVVSYTPVVEGDTHYDNAVLTSGYTYLLEVRDDAQTTVREVERYYPAVSAFGHIGYGGVLYYVTRSGIVSLRGATLSLITSDILTEVEFAAFSPSSMKLTGHDDRLFMWYYSSAVGHKGLLLTLPDYDARREMTFSRLSLPIKHAMSVPDAGMRVLYSHGIYEWGASSNNLRYTWRSRYERFTGYWKPVSMKVIGYGFGRQLTSMDKAAKKAYALWQKQFCTLGVDEFLDAHPEYISSRVALVGASAVNVGILRDGHVLYRRVIYRETPTRLPKFGRGFDWAVELSATFEVNEVHLQGGIKDMTLEGGQNN